MSWQQKENVIKEKRTIEATKKNLMGPSGKLGIIVKSLGSPIMRQGGTYNDVSYLEDPYENFVDTEFETTMSEQNGPVAWRDEILESEEGAGSVHEDNPNWEGYAFDGLSRGMHFEIQYMRHLHQLTVYYKGFEVYKEIAGELDAYAPFPEWEDIVGKLYKSAKAKSEEIKEQDRIELTKELERKRRLSGNGCNEDGEYNKEK